MLKSESKNLFIMFSKRLVKNKSWHIQSIILSYNQFSVKFENQVDALFVLIGYYIWIYYLKL